MKMRYTVIIGTALATVGGVIFAFGYQSQMCIDPHDYQTCMRLTREGGWAPIISAFTGLGFIASVLLTPVFLTNADEDKRKVKWRAAEVAELQALPATPEVTARIEKLKLEISAIQSVGGVAT